MPRTPSRRNTDSTGSSTSPRRDEATAPPTSATVLISPRGYTRTPGGGSEQGQGIRVGCRRAGVAVPVRHGEGRPGEDRGRAARRRRARHRADDLDAGVQRAGEGAGLPARGLRRAAAPTLARDLLPPRRAGRREAVLAVVRRPDQG